MPSANVDGLTVAGDAQLFEGALLINCSGYTSTDIL